MLWAPIRAESGQLREHRTASAIRRPGTQQSPRRKPPTARNQLARRTSPRRRRHAPKRAPPVAQ
eukprot:13377897-Alexandrium_andersonii.AAC.1